MSRKKIDLNAVIQPVSGASRISGLSRRFIINGCKDGKIPHLMVGGDYRIDMVLWMEQLHQQAAQEDMK